MDLENQKRVKDFA
ncbi:MAG: hypothetical protein HFG85_09775, partial [Dorea sp.]|nr:hypothetical protein [Dorea sp.]